MPRVINQLSAIFDIEKVHNVECTETCQPVCLIIEMHFYSVYTIIPFKYIQVVKQSISQTHPYRRKFHKIQQLNINPVQYCHLSLEEKLQY
jgi:hypothetical protein